MQTEKFITILATLIGAFWIILQVITHIHEKGTRNALLALAILVVVAIPAVYLLNRHPAADPMPSTRPAVAHSPSPVPSSGLTLQPSPSPSASGSPAMEAAFTVLVSHNLVGGINRVALHCTFNASGSVVTLSGYSATIHVRARSESEPRDHVFDRVLEKPVVITAGAPVVVDVPVDPEISEQLLAYRKDATNAWVRVSWRGKTDSDVPVRIESANNGQ